ncbi:MAG: CotH kinase family protein [Lachnospiraceae bacterium]|nr:CotH kinase family protein [Lachnospiraceae bacterium]
MKKHIFKNIFFIISILTLCIIACACSLNIFNKKVLPVPVIKVTTHDGNGCSLKKSDGYVSADIVITDVYGSEMKDSANFKVRGNTTALDWIDKKSYAIKFEEKKNILDMGSGKKWALLANAFDPTLLRNYIAFETAYELEIPYASEQRFVELWVDDSFRGSYMLYETVQKGSDRVDIDIKSDKGMKDFLIELDMKNEDEDETFFTIDEFKFRAAEPENPNDEQLNYIIDTMSGIIKALKSGHKDEVIKKLDMPSFTKYYLMNEYFKPFDFGVTSVYFYYKDGLLYAGPPWDYDLSMGNSNDEFGGRFSAADATDGIFADKNLFSYLAKKTWFKKLVRDEFTAHKAFFSKLHTDGGILDTIYNTYSEEISRNYNDAGWDISKWQLNIQRPPAKTYEENYNLLKGWLAERYMWFERY